MELHNTKTGETLQVSFRPFKPRDAREVIACIRDEYGGTYFKRDFYRPEYIIQENERGHINFMVAQTAQGDIAGFMILKHFLPKEQMVEIASQIFKKRYRGFGMAEKLFDYAMEMLMRMPCSGIYCLPVTFHDISQRLLARQGLKGTGFIFSVFDMELIQQSYGERKNRKHGQTVQILAKDKKDAGLLYVPKEHMGITAAIYSRLGVGFSLAGPLAGTAPSPKDATVLEYAEDLNNACCAIHIPEPGADLKRQVAGVMARFREVPYMTFNVFLNVNHPCAVTAYEALKEMGYFFTGYQALCSEREFMILHNPMDVELDFSDFVLSEEFRWILDYIEPFYAERNRTSGGEKALPGDGGILHKEAGLR